ncbi:MAG: hypothetical protein COB20_08275 [SAR86 cluster bacterium]|uniref:Uncharacterized protein n=1 Tax=SAR86 cluster bacterium TaxID=2030880 RepID=A0A2A4X4A1_9GAMM|nr:MAG: hypothetical protein COB20_08275 [SAR86 cluster bacterium]
MNNKIGSRPAFSKRLFALLAVIILSGLIFVPSANAQNCPAGGMPTAGPIELVSCTEFIPSNSASITLTLPTVVVNDVLIAVIQTDDANNNGTFSEDGGPYWSALGDNSDTGTIDSQMFFHLVAAGDPTANTTFSWTGNERSFGYILHFRGASATFDPGTRQVNGNSLTPQAPALTTTVDNTLVLRTLSTDRFPYNDNAGTPTPGFTLINSDNAGNGNGGVGGASGFLEQVAAATLVAQANWALTGNGEGGEQTHTRTVGIRPAPEFRFSMLDASSSVCGVQSVTLEAVDANGNVLDWYLGTVDLSIVASVDATGATWVEPGAGVPGILLGGVGGNGAATFEFVAGDAGSVTLEFYVPTHTQTIDFNVVETGGGIYGESPDDVDYTSPTLTILNCEFVVTNEAGNQVETCAMEAVTISLLDTAGNPATNYTGTLTIDNGSGSTFGNYTLTSGSFALTNTPVDDGIATYPFVITPSTPGTPHVLVVNYIHGSTSTTTVDLALTEDSGFAFPEAAGNISLTVAACEIIVSLPDADLTRDVCTMTRVTFEIQAGGLAVSNFSGVIDITAAVGLTGQGFWFENLAEQPYPGSLSGGGVGDGTASYDFNGSEGGAVTFDFRNDIAVTGLDFGATGLTDEGIALPQGGATPTIDVAQCILTVTAANFGSPAFVCLAESVTYKLTTPGGADAVDYEGTVTIQTSTSAGNYVQTSGSNVLSGAGGDDGLASYQFHVDDDGEFTVDYSVLAVPVGDDVTFTATLSNFTLVNTSATLTYSNCEVIVTLPDADLTRDVCTMTRVTFEVQANGSAITNFSGVINLTAAVGLAGQGLWFENLAEQPYPGSLTGGGVGDGTASYDFNGTENGAVTFDFRNSIAVTGLDFGATGLTDEGVALPQGGATPTIDVAQCILTVTAANFGAPADVCRAGESVTYKLTTPGGTDAVDYNGTVILQTSTLAGNYVQTSGSNVLSGPGGNDGFASYKFHVDDDGEFTVDYSVLAVPAGDDVTFTATISNFTLVNTSATLTYRACVFNISFPSDTAPFETDVCSIKQVRIDLVDFDGDPVTDYTGTINLSTSTGFGSWSEDASAIGTVIDSFGEDGAASYTFIDTNPGTDVDDDDGVVILNFTHTAAAAAAMNINVSDTITTDPGNPGSTDDPNLVIDVCTFQISFDGGGGSLHSDASLTACEIQAVTIEVFDSAGAIALNYAGQMNLSTDTNNGNWTVNTGTNGLTNVVIDGGEASYLFDTADNGVVVLDFTNQNSETVNIDIVDEVIALALDGVMVEEGAADPSLEIGSCIPAVAQRVCAAGNAPSFTISLPITAQDTDPNLQGRMVAVGTSMEGPGNGSLLTVSDVQFNGQSFNVVGQAERLIETRIDESPNSSYTTLWAMNEQLLPALANNYNVEIFHNNDEALAACAFFLTDVEQTFPAEDVGTPNDGQINASGSADNAITIASTILTTTQNNALILSIVGIGNPADTSDVSPSPPMVNFSPQPTDTPGAGFGGASGNASNAAAITIDQTMSIDPTFRHTHVIAAFNPLISGPAVAVGFEPVVLFRTYSGNLSYRAIGASYQDAPNTSGVCSLVSPLEATADLQLPDAADGVLAANGAPFSAAGEFDSDVRAAWLYWFASGSFDLPNMDGFGAYPNTKTPANFDNVTFSTPNGLGGFNVTNITADDIFAIENAGSDGNADFYVAYKDVTGLMVGTSNEGTGSDEDPNGDYTITNIEIDDNEPWIDRGSCAGGFALVVVYENPYEQLRVINLFHGFQPFQHSAFTLVPRNFRIAGRDTVSNTPNGQVTHITVEGDAAISGTNESLTIQNTPGDFDPGTFNGLTTDFNPADEEFNGTITRPVYALTDVFTGGTGEPTEYKYIFDDSSGVNGNPSNGVEIDFPNPAVFPFTPPGAALTEYGLSYGVDIDTHFIDGDEIGDILYEFADPTDLAEEITTRYAADQDLVLLVAEIISVSNAPIADIEVIITEADASYKVGSNGVYNIEVKNNGNGAVTFGEATGIIELVGELPSGMTFADGGGEITGTGWVCSDSGNSATAFTCTYDITANLGIGGLGDASLPTVSATVTIASPPAFFPSLNNDAKLIVRVQHSDGTCLGASTGILPTPTSNCEPPEFDNVNDLQGGTLDINDIDDKTGGNNNVDSITTNVQGIETDLSVVKEVTTILEEGSSDTILYTITVTNNGPDDIVAGLTQPAMTIIDNEPSDLNFDSASGDFWTCNVNVGVPDQLVCTFDNSVGLMTPLLNGESSVITLVGDVLGTSPTPVTNTAQVSSGTYNFDIVPGNNTSGTTDNIEPVPAAVTDKFLLSVSAAAALNTTSLGSGGGLLSDFSDDDIVLYDPALDAASLFIDSATTPSYNVSDPNAIHLLPNGQVLLSSNEDGNTIGTNGQAFDKDDIVLYDKLLNTATLLFDGALITDDGGDAIDLNIDAVYMLDEGLALADRKIIFSTAGPASDGGIVLWSDSDLVQYDPVAGTFSIYLDAEDNNVFDAVDAQVDALYLRVDPADSTLALDTIVVSSEVQGAVLGDNNVVVGRDDVAEITIDAGSRPTPTATTATNLFNGGIPIGVFDTAEGDLKLNALHLIEPAHLGHFDISQITPGNACAPATIRIRKHKVLGVNTHVTDTIYEGSILITTDSMPENGIWSVDTGTPANLDNSYGGGTDNGQALYTFALADNGEVTLTLDVSEVTPVIDSVSVSVTNGFVVDEDNDSPFVFNLVSTDVDYQDNFAVAALNNNDGSAGWSFDWAEVDALNGMATGPGSGLGMGTGNIQMTGGKLTFTSNLTTDGGAIDPSMTRAAGLGLFTYAEPVLIKFDYGFQSASNSGDVIELQISNDDVDYVTVQTYDMLDGTSGSDFNETIDISAFISNVAADDIPDDPNLIIIDGTDANLYVRWVLVSGYVLGTFTVDNFEITTSTNACATGGMNHYHIDIPSTGLACVASGVTITAHSFEHNPVDVDPATVLNLSTFNNSGTWARIISGGGTLTDIGALVSDTDGMGTYIFPGGESSVQLAFNYTDPAGDGATVNIDLTDGTFTEIKQTALPFDDSHDPNSDFAEAGLLFYDQDTGALSTTLPFQIAGKPALTAPASGNVTLQIVRSVPIPGENAAAACESIVDDGDVVTVTFAGLCIDPMGCDVSAMSIFDSGLVERSVPVFNGNTLNPEQQVTATDLTLEFSDLGLVIDGEANIGAPINFIYPDAGQISLHAEYDLPFEDVIATASGDTINGASSTFVVRPFAFDIDFSDDRGNSVDLSLAADADGSAFARAGVGFNATVSAVIWEQGDDVELVDGSPGNDGIADFEADLSDNLVATNFGDEAVDNNTVIVSVLTTDPTNGGAANPGVPAGVVGTMVIVDGSSDVFQSFSNGVSGPQFIAIDEVGIFDLAAELVDDDIGRNLINYFETVPYTAVEGVVGGARNVGRIYPNNFELISSSFGPRSNQEMVCAMASPFTYMGEDFTINITLEAKNFQTTTLQNYFGGFAKLNSFVELDIRGIIDVDVGADIDLVADMRFERSTFPDEFGSLTVSTMDDWSAGQILLSGDLRITRQASGVEDAPLENVKISINPTDNNINDGDTDDLVASNDVLLDVFDVELDDGAPDVDPLVGPWQFAEIAEHEFRYGRLIVENAFGSESEDLNIGIRIEYYDGNDFVVNAADSCTAIVQTNGAEELAYVPGTYEDAGADYLPPLAPFADGVTEIEGAPGIDVTVTVFEGQSDPEADSDADLTNDSDRPFFTSAPDPESVGRVLVELDLDPNDDDSPSSLYFLEYDWRGGAVEPGDLYDEAADGVYTDNPRGIIEFGSYRGHDRVINWQEIYIGPTSP